MSDANEEFMAHLRKVIREQRKKVVLRSRNRREPIPPNETREQRWVRLDKKHRSLEWIYTHMSKEDKANKEFVARLRKLIRKQRKKNMLEKANEN